MYIIIRFFSQILCNLRCAPAGIEDLKGFEYKKNKEKSYSESSAAPNAPTN